MIGEGGPEERDGENTEGTEDAGDAGDTTARHGADETRHAGGAGGPRSRPVRYALRDAVDEALGDDQGDDPNDGGGPDSDAITPVAPRAPLARAVRRGSLTATFSAVAPADPAASTAPTDCDGSDNLPPGTGDYEEQ